MSDVAVLTSRSGRVKSARRLTARATRASERLFLAEGPQAVREALALPGCVVEVFATPAATDRLEKLRRHARVQSLQWHLVDEPALDSLAATRTPQGVVAVCRFIDVGLDELPWPDIRLLAVCADVRDPGNAGTVIRCADAAGAGAVVLTGSSVDPYNAKTVRASAGSLFHLPVVVAPAVKQSLATISSHGLVVLAADGGGSVSLDDLEPALLAGRTAWLFGNEAWGLPPELRVVADHVVAVPMYGGAESLNLATAAAICLYASAREQHRAP